MVKFFSMKMKHVPEASDIPSFADAVGTGSSGVEHHLDVVAQASGFSEKEANDLDAFVAAEGWGGGDNDGADDDDDEKERDEDGGDSEHGKEGSKGEPGASGLEEGGSGEEGDGSSCSDEEDGDENGRIRRVKAPETMTKRAHAAVQRQRKAAGAGGGVKPSRNHQKRKEKGKMLYKHRDF